MSNSTKQWYALFTKEGFEKKVANILSRKNIENYCPLKRQISHRKKASFEPLFNSFVFIFINESEMLRMRAIDGVVNFVHWLGKPARISNEEIEIMRRFMNEYSEVRLEKIVFNLEAVDKGGVIQGNDKRVHMVSVKNNTVKILLPSLGYNIIAESVNTNVEVIISSKQTHSMGENYKFAI